MPSLGRSVAKNTIVKGNIAAAAAGATTHNGRAVDLASLPRPSGVRAHLHLKANLDAADTLVVDAIKLESATTSSFAGAVTRVTAADQVLTGAATDTDYTSDTYLDFDLARLPEDHTWLRVTARSTLSDVTNTSGVVCATLIFGGMTLS